jgi:hypothetical protein
VIVQWDQFLILEPKRAMSVKRVNTVVPQMVLVFVLNAQLDTKVTLKRVVLVYRAFLVNLTMLREWRHVHHV